MMPRVLQVLEHGEPHLYDVGVDDLDRMRELIGGGWLEAIYGPDWCAFLDEEGKLKGLRPNTAAEAVARTCGWQGDWRDYLAGPVVFVGPPNVAGDFTDVPDHVLAYFAGHPNIADPDS